MSVQLGLFGVSERLILWRCLLRPMCPVMMHIPVRYLVRLLRLFVSILSVFVWWLPSIRSVCACLLEFHLVCVRLLTLSFITFLMWFSGTRLHTKLLLIVPALASSSAFSLPQCHVLYCVFVCKFGECFMAVSDGFVLVYFIEESL